MNSNFKSGYKTTEFYAVAVAEGSLIWKFIQTNCSISPAQSILLVGGIVSLAWAYLAHRSELKTYEETLSPTDKPVARPAVQAEDSSQPAQPTQ